MPSRLTSLIPLFTLTFAASLHATSLLVDHTFDGVVNDTGGLTFQTVKNPVDTVNAASANLATGVITTGQGSGSQATASAIGFNTGSSFDVTTAAPAANGFTITFHVAGIAADVLTLDGNGLFLGVVTGTDANGTGGSSLWNNNPYAIGYVMSNQSYSNHILRQDAEGGATNDGNSVNTAFANIPTLPSYQDGFTITLGLFDDESWSLTSTGLSTNIDSTGSLATGTGMKSYAQIAAAVTPYLSLQGRANSTITVDRITITAIEAPVPAGPLIDYTFDSNAVNEVGPVVQMIDNGVASGAANTSSGVITTAAANNHTLGFNSSGTVDLSSFDGLKATFVVDSITATDVAGLLNNGLFFGLVAGPNATGTTGSSLWNNDPRSFGYVPGSDSWGSHVMAENTGSLNITTASLTTAQPTNASLLDGFTVTISVFKDDTWQIASTGLSTELTQRGTLPNLSYSDFANAGIYVSLQGEGGAQIKMGRMTISGLSLDDTDEDDMPDFWEDANSLNKNDPNDADDDDDANGGPDGLTNLEEYQNGTDPQDSDSDNDGLNDGDEVNGTLNPWMAGVKGSPPGDPTDPNNANSDGEGLNDGAEVAAGSDPNAPPPNSGFISPFVDTDGDSYRDEAEIAFGSNPADTDDCPDHTPSPQKPNIVIIYADDLGFGDISRYGNLFGTPSASPTPNVDTLADQGVTFTQAHSANAVCTPSRYSLLTGIYNWRNFQSISGHYGYKGGIDNIPLDSDVTLAEFLKTQGYDTAAFGKWHLGGKWYAAGTNNRITNNPSNPAAVDWTRRIEGHATDIGFDYFRGLGAVINFGPYAYLHDDIVQYWVEDGTALNEYGNKLPNGRKGYFRDATASDSFTWLSTDDLNSSVVGATDSRASLGDPSYRQIDAGPIMVADFERYVDERVASSDSDPFFAYVSLYSPHKPWAITPEFNNGTYGSFDYARWMAEVDDRIGRILAAIDDNGMKNSTLVIFTADNGPETTAMSQTLANGADANGPLRGAKRDIWDGGTRVPFIVRWPGQTPAGMVVTDEVISQVDIFPTVAGFLGAELPDTTAPDGESFLNVLRGQRKPDKFRAGVVLCSINGHLALKTPDGWKLIDSTGGGGNSSSWDSGNSTIPSAIGTKQGTPKQLFELPVDLGEDDNRISTLASDSAIRAELIELTGRDLLSILDQLRSTGAATLDGREPDNDADGMSNSFETANGLDRDSPKDALLDKDGDGTDNLSESVAGTDPNDPGSVFRIVDLQNSSASLSISWPSVVGRTYEVFWSTDLTTWTSDSNHPGTGSEITVPLDKALIDSADAISGNLSSLFVRVTVIE